MEMDQKLRKLMQQLGNAIAESLSGSEKIDAAVAEVRAAGYDVFLLVEATIGFSRRGEPHERLHQPQKPIEAKLRFSAQDQKFLKSLKIDSK